MNGKMLKTVTAGTYLLSYTFIYRREQYTVSIDHINSSFPSYTLSKAILSNRKQLNENKKTINLKPTILNMMN